MALIVETGAIVANANSYVSLSDCRAYAAARALALPVPDADLEALLIGAMDYLEGQRARYQGAKVSPSTQALQWPRTGVYIDGVAFSETSIPKELKDAQSRLACEKFAGVDIMPTKIGPFVSEETVGPLTTKYSADQGAGVQPTISAVDALLEPLFSQSVASAGFSLRTVRA